MQHFAPIIVHFHFYKTLSGRPTQDVDEKWYLVIQYSQPQVIILAPTLLCNAGNSKMNTVHMNLSPIRLFAYQSICLLYYLFQRFNFWNG